MDLWKGTSESDLVSQSSGCMSITEGPFEIVRPDSSGKKSSEKGKKKRKVDKTTRQTEDALTDQTAKSDDQAIKATSLAATNDNSES